MSAGWCIFSEIALRWMSLDLTDNKSTLDQVMAWCRQADLWVRSYLHWDLVLAAACVSTPGWAACQPYWAPETQHHTDTTHGCMSAILGTWNTTPHWQYSWLLMAACLSYWVPETQHHTDATHGYTWLHVCHTGHLKQHHTDSTHGYSWLSYWAPETQHHTDSTHGCMSAILGTWNTTPWLHVCHTGYLKHNSTLTLLMAACLPY